MSKTAQPHDRFCRILLEHPKAAAALLRERLPEEIAQMLSPEPPQLVEGTFIDQELRLSQSDRLFRVRLRSDRPGYVYCLIEHKSAPEAGIALQLLRYLTMIWQRLAREAGPKGLLPPIFPLVIYQGIERWRVPLDFQGIIDADEAVKGHLLNFRYGLVELGRIPDERLSREPTLRVGLLVLKRILRARGVQEEQEALVALLPLLERQEWGFLEAAFAYIMSVFQLDRAAFEEAVRRSIPVQEAKMVSKAVQEWRAEGRAEGREEGRAEGREEGRAEGRVEGKLEDLRKLLERRFGPLSEERREALRAARIADLDLWFDRALDVASIEEVFVGIH